MTTREEIKRLVNAVIDKALDSPTIDLPRAVADLMSAIDRVLAREAALEKVLREYGRHKQGCYDKRQVVPRCVCGLSAALSGEPK